MQTYTQTYLDGGFNRMKKSKKHNSLGFTLVELLVVIGLIAVTAGVSSDIVLNIVRSYSKTKVTNEIDQIANFVFLKIEKELKTALSITSPSSGSPSETLSFTKTINNSIREVVYEKTVEGGIRRKVNSTPGADDGTFEDLFEVSPTSPVISNSDVFTLVNASPAAVRVKFLFIQNSANGSPIFSGNISLEQTIVLRGTY